MSQEASVRGVATAMPRMRRAVAFCAALGAAGAANALTLPDCTRTTHVSHGGEADHRDLGDGRVMWRDWWSQEATATGFKLVDCAPGRALMFRTAEENMGPRLPFDRTEKALKVVENHESGARAFATFERMAADLQTIARDIEIVTLTREPCACAVLYPEQRGDKAAFEVTR